jgi:molecular chaperone DnaJ
VNGNREWLEKDYYKALGVPKNASQAEIKKAYRRLAQQHHPDANAGDKSAEERFKEVSAAYEVLGNEKKRSEYDRFREMAGAGFRFGGPGGFRTEGAQFGEGFGGLFDDLLGGFGFGETRQSTRARGADLEAEVRISLEDAAAGTTVPLTVAGAVPCRTCGGSGAKPGTEARTCPECGGSGSVAINQGFFSIARACPQCSGVGRIVDDPCRTCRGSGQTRERRTLTVRVPAGIQDGARIRLAEKGEAGPPGGRPGDLYVRVRVAPHPMFRRQGSDLTLAIPVTFPEAALGANVKVPTLNGAVTLKVPAGTPSGKTFRIRGKGLPKRAGGKGDLLATIQVEVPSRLTKEERELIERFREVHRASPRERLDGTDQRGEKSG